jgi:hypothetical protein
VALDPAFARDLGYLDKFFDKIDAHAATLDAAAGARLRALVLEERARWGEIRGLISGEPVKASAPASQVPATPVGPATVSRPRPQFTVGSLIAKP